MSGEPVAVVIMVEAHTEPQLPQVAQARDGLGAAFGATQRGEEHRRENGDDSDDNEEFNEREGSGAAVLSNHIHSRSLPRAAAARCRWFAETCCWFAAARPTQTRTPKVVALWTPFLPAIILARNLPFTRVIAELLKLDEKKVEQPCKVVGHWH